MAASDLLPDTVAEWLRAEDTRAGTLQALDALPSPCPSELALAAAPALVDVAAVTEDREVLDRCGLLLARLLAEAAPDPSALYGAALGGERLAAWFAPRLLVEATQRALGNGSGEGGRQPLGREDAYSFACMCAWMSPAFVRGVTAPEAAAGRTVMEHMRTVRALFLHSIHSSTPSCWFTWRTIDSRVVLCRRSCVQWMSVDPIMSQKQMPSDDVPQQLLALSIELLRSRELPELAIGG
eukprot:COSAG02_NODE_4461_length_5336_cov_3.180829_1_plen_238_part_10